jgi:hypothetical protein
MTSDTGTSLTAAGNEVDRETPTSEAENVCSISVEHSEEAPIRHPDLYFPDGSVILHAGDTLFCVHMSQLSRHSQFFKDMFSLAEPDKSVLESFVSPGSRRPTVRLYDSPTDVANLLQALYDGP